VLSLACDSESLLTFGVDPPESGPAAAAGFGLSGTGFWSGAGFCPAKEVLSLDLSGAGVGNSGLVTPTAAADTRSAGAGGGVAPEAGEGIGLVADVAAGRETGGFGAPESAEPSDPDEPGDFAESLDESDELLDEALPFWPASLRSLPDLLSLSVRESDAVGSGFFRTTVSG